MCSLWHFFLIKISQLKYEAIVNFTTVNPLRGNFFDAMFMLTRLHKNPQTIKLYIQDDCNCDFKKPTHREKKN